MISFQRNLPQLEGDFFLTDGGLETTLIFHQGMILPDFAAFVLLDRSGGAQVLRDYYLSYARIAERFGAGLVLEGPTWRANSDWGARLGYDAMGLDSVNRRAIELLQSVREELDLPSSKVVVSGCVGPRGDGYVPGSTMSEVEALDYHRAQISSFARAEVDIVSAFTINYLEEAIGIVLAAKEREVPVTISFTLETDGRLPTGQSLSSAIDAVDEATERYAAYFQINCAHPSHFRPVLEEDSHWVGRIRGIRANASCRSHAELDDAADLDVGDPADLGVQYAELKVAFPALTILGGCCGTDVRHVERIAEACAPHFVGVA